MSELNPLSENPLPQESPLSAFDDFLPSSGEGDTAPARFREGLPASYRMRADAHYVDQLESARPTATPAGRRSSSPTPHGLGESDVLTALQAISSCAALMDDDVSGLTRQVATSLIRAEAWRSTCLLQASRIIRHGLAPSRRGTQVRKLMSRIVESIAPESRLRGVQVETILSVGDGVVVAGHEDTLVFVLSGLALLTIEQASRSADAAIVIAALPEPAGKITLAISQDTATVPESWPSLVADPGAENAGTWSTPMPVLALRKIAEAYGGSVSPTRFAIGSRIILELPVAAARPA